MKTKKVTVELPQKQIVRFRRVSYRVWMFDFRGITNTEPSQADIDRLYGKKKTKEFSGIKPIFESTDTLQEQCDAYFESCFAPLINKNGEIVYDNNGNIVKVQKRPFTVSGLAYHLGVETSTLNRYTNGQMDDLGAEDADLLFSSVLKRAKQRIEIFAEENLYNRDAQAGARFVLDAHFKRITQKEQAEIQERMENILLKKEELELKKQGLGAESDDMDLNITIVRKE